MKKLFLIFAFVYINNAFSADVYTNDIPNGCVLDEITMFAVYRGNSYTCNAGYFLPASSDTCQPCPAGYTCNGGTFEAKINQAQGLTRTSNQIKDDAIYACDINFPKNMYALFVPNEPDVITVYFNNNGQIETTTCEADGELTLPETPTRVGYVFAGWKVNNTPAE